MSTKATAAHIYEYGEPDVFRFETMEVPDPIGHEVLVRNTVIGLNFVDIYYRRGTLPVPEFPAIIGDEASGVVEAVGPNVTLVKVGDSSDQLSFQYVAFACRRSDRARRYLRFLPCTIGCLPSPVWRGATWFARRYLRSDSKSRRGRY